jgi:hypothetical protein
MILNQILNFGSLQTAQALTDQEIVAKMRGLDEDGYPHLSFIGVTEGIRQSIVRIRGFNTVITHIIQCIGFHI